MTLDVLTYVLACVVGLLVGSFLNVVIYRMPISLFRDWEHQAREILVERGVVKEKQLAPQSSETFNIAYPPSHCPSCKTPIKPWHNIPVLSYVFLLKGKCLECKTPISVRYPIVEFVTGILTLFVVYSFGVSIEAGFVIVFTWSLLVLTLIDADHQILPDDITFPLLWLGLLANTFNTFTDLESAVIGAMAGYLSLWSIYWLFKLIAKKEGMGYGDFKLLAAMGAWMGWQDLGIIIVLSSFVGAAIGIAGILIYGKDKNKPIPFGPYLAIAGWLTFFWGDTLKTHYFQLFNVG